MKLHVINSRPKCCFFLACKPSVIVGSPINVSDNGLFQVNGEASCLFRTWIWQVIKTRMLPTALGFPDGMSHHSVFTLEILGFS